MNFQDILLHPKNEDIVAKLIKGVQPAEVAQWLKLEYPDKDQEHLRLSEKLLKEFAKSPYLDYSTQVKNDLVKIEKGEAIDKRISKSLLNNKTYQERLNEYAEESIDIKKRLIEFDKIFRDRMEQLFDRIQDDPSNIGTPADYKFLKFFEQYIKLIEYYDKSVNQKPDQIIQHNYTMEYIDKRTVLLQDAIRATLEKLGPEAPSIFMEELNKRLESLEYNEDNKLPKIDTKVLED
jgi:hypothetical protein